MNYDTFCKQARAALSAYDVDQLLNQLPMMLRTSRWHPNGFVVTHLGNLDGLGKLRFHVWPRNLRNARHGHPPVHCHDWHLTSRVLAGKYSDARYQVVPTTADAPQALEGLLIRYQHNGPDLIEPSGTFWEVNRSADDSFPGGTFHYLAAGEYHSTPIPHRDFAATLLIMSDHVIPNPMILGRPQSTTIEWTRPGLSDTEYAEVLAQCEELNVIPLE